MTVDPERKNQTSACSSCYVMVNSVSMLTLVLVTITCFRQHGAALSIGDLPTEFQGPSSRSGHAAARSRALSRAVERGMRRQGPMNPTEISSEGWADQPANSSSPLPLVMEGIVRAEELSAFPRQRDLNPASPSRRRRRQISGGRADGASVDDPSSATSTAEATTGCGQGGERGDCRNTRRVSFPAGGLRRGSGRPSRGLWSLDSDDGQLLEKETGEEETAAEDGRRQSQLAEEAAGRRRLPAGTQGDARGRDGREELGLLPPGQETSGIHQGRVPGASGGSFPRQVSRDRRPAPSPGSGGKKGRGQDPLDSAQRHAPPGPAETSSRVNVGEEVGRTTLRKRTRPDPGLRLTTDVACVSRTANHFRQHYTRERQNQCMCSQNAYVANMTCVLQSKRRLFDVKRWLMNLSPRRFPQRLVGTRYCSSGSGERQEESECVCRSDIRVAVAHHRLMRRLTNGGPLCPPSSITLLNVFSSNGSLSCPPCPSASHHRKRGDRHGPRHPLPEHAATPRTESAWPEMTYASVVSGPRASTRDVYYYAGQRFRPQL